MDPLFILQNPYHRDVRVTGTIEGNPGDLSSHEQTYKKVLISSIIDRPLVKSAYQKNNFLISQPKHMLWVLKRTVSIRRFF